MSTVAELLKKGELSSALDTARADAAQRAADPAALFVLFELLVLHEDFDGAEAQLSQIGDRAPAAAQPFQLFRGLLAAERARYRFRHEGQGDVAFLAKPPAWAAAFARAAAQIGKGEVEQAASALQQAWKSAPTVGGWADGLSFHSIRDADDMCGPFLEVVVPGRWAWIPFAQLESVRFEEPQGFQDVIWRPAQVEIKDGPKGRMWVPSVYSGTGVRDDMQKLGRITTFDYPARGLCRGYGQRDLKLDDSMLLGILSVRSLVIDHGQATQADATN